MALFRFILILLVSFPVYSYGNETIKICLTGRIVKNLPSYEQSYVNAAILAKNDFKTHQQVELKTYFYDNNPLAAIQSYSKMLEDKCNAIIGYEYLTDLELIIKTQNNIQNIILSTYATTANNKSISKNVILLMPTYNYLAQKMLSFLEHKYGKLNKLLLITDISRSDMVEYKCSYLGELQRRNISYTTFDFIENDKFLIKKIKKTAKYKNYKYIVLLAGAMSSAKIANYLNNEKIIFIGTENYGSQTSPSFYLRLKDKKINSFFIRNISYLMPNKLLYMFFERYKKTYNTAPTVLSAYIYDAVAICLKALSKQGFIDGKTVLTIEYNGITGAGIRKGKFYRSRNYAILSVKENGYHYEK